MNSFDIVAGTPVHDAECAAVLGRAICHAFQVSHPAACERASAFETFSSQRRTRRVAYQANRIVGFVDWRDSEVVFLMVDPPYHQRGIGTALLQGASDSIGTGIWLLCVKQNTTALAFYEHRGFCIDGERPGRMFGCAMDNYVLSRRT